MVKYNIIVPIITEKFDFKNVKAKLKAFFTELELEYNVLFILSKNYKKTKNLTNVKGFKIIKTDMININDLITQGFKETEIGNVIVLGQEEFDNYNILKKMLEKHRQGADVVLINKNKKSGFFKHLFNGVFEQIYYYYLKFFGIQKDYLASNTIQLFTKNVVDVIKTLPNKNAYLRNFNTFVGFKVKVLALEEKNDYKVLKHINLKQRNIIFGVALFVISFVSLMLIAFFNKFMLSFSNGITYYLLTLIAIATMFFFSGYFVFKEIVEQRMNSKSLK